MTDLSEAILKLAEAQHRLAISQEFNNDLRTEEIQQTERNLELYERYVKTQEQATDLAVIKLTIDNKNSSTDTGE